MSKLQEQLKMLLDIVNVLKYKVPTRLLPSVQSKADQLLKVMKKLGYDVTIYQGFRSIEEQNKLYAQGRTKPGAIVTNAKGGESLHNYGVAADIVFVRNGRPSWAENHPWATLGKEGEKLGFEWGGRWISFQDRPHFQLTGSYSLSDFQNKKVNYLLIK